MAKTRKTLKELRMAETCAVRLCSRKDMLEGDELCPKHRGRFEKAKARGRSENWAKSNHVEIAHDVLYWGEEALKEMS